MNTKKQDAALIGAGAAACAVCCAGPILGVLAAVGLGTAFVVALFGSIGLVIAAMGTLIVVRRRRRSRAACEAPSEQLVEIQRR